MNHPIRRAIIRFAPIVCLACLLPDAHAQWTVPTPEELQMTSQPEVPGAAAVYLFREEITDDKLHYWSKYVRLKVLTERGKEYANVELRQYQVSGGGGYKVSEIQGRTIHPDGTIIPFTGKPFEKLIEKTQGVKEMAKVFTLPDVEVGSIIEYRYQLTYDDYYFIAPSWFVQSDLYTRKAHYLWRPTDKPLVSKDERGEEVTSTIAWFKILPPGFDVKQTRPPGGYDSGQATLDLAVHDIPPAPEDEFMPPMQSLSDRVLFYYSPYHTVDEYWKNEGKKWSKQNDKFIGPDSGVKKAAAELVAPSDTDDQKLHKLYAAVMTFDNTDYNRGRSAEEEKAQGLTPPKSTADILERKRGTADQITQLFVALARASGMKAYVMAVTNRDSNMFLPAYLNFSQLDDLVAVVSVGGKDQFFDPGQRFCPYGHLAWKHAMVSGLRQTDVATAIVQTPIEAYSASRTQRVANLTMDEHGEATGSVKMTWIGAPALTWRHRYLRGDATGLNRDLRVAVEHLMPGGMDIKVDNIQNLEDYEQPLVVNYEVKGQIASTTGKRLLLPGDIFEFDSKPKFPHEKREVPVYFDYPYADQDAVRINFPASLSVESLPAAEQLPLLQKFAIYTLKTESTPTSITVRREFDLGNIIFKVEEYPDLRAFYNKVETKDQEPVVLKSAAQPPVGN